MKKILPLVLFGMLVLIGCAEKTAKEQTPEPKETTDTDIAVDASQSTFEVANAFMGAMGKGDMETMIGLMHDDMVWENSGDKSLPWIGPWYGKESILKDFLPVFGENFKTLKWTPTDGFANGDTAAYFGQMKGLLTHSGQETDEFTYALRVKVKDGKVILWNWFEDSYEVSRAYHNN